MIEAELEVPTPDGPMTVFTVHPDAGGPHPVAVVFMDGVGYREQVKENARRFAAGGYFCVAPDLYHRAGRGLHFDVSRMASGLESPDADRLRAAAASVTPEHVVADTEAALAAAASDPAAAAGARVCVGYCLGARAALTAVSRLPGEFAAAAGIHPGALVTEAADSPHRDLATVRGELYFAFAEQDRTATPESIDRFREEMAARGVRGEVERLPGTTHGFAMEDLPVYQREATERHFEKTLALWRRSLAGEPATA